MSFATRPTPETINRKFSALVRHMMPEPGSAFEFVDYAVFNDEGRLVDIFHHIKSVSTDFSDGWKECNDFENGLSGQRNGSPAMLALLAEGYEYDAFGLADYVAACARTYPDDRPEWNAAWVAIFPYAGIR